MHKHYTKISTEPINRSPLTVCLVGHLLQAPNCSSTNLVLVTVRPAPSSGVVEIVYAHSEFGANCKYLDLLNYLLTYCLSVRLSVR